MVSPSIIRVFFSISLAFFIYVVVLSILMLLSLLLVSLSLSLFPHISLSTHDYLSLYLRRFISLEDFSLYSRIFFSLFRRFLSILEDFTIFSKTFFKKKLLPGLLMNKLKQFEQKKDCVKDASRLKYFMLDSWRIFCKIYSQIYGTN